MSQLGVHFYLEFLKTKENNRLIAMVGSHLSELRSKLYQFK